MKKITLVLLSFFNFILVFKVFALDIHYTYAWGIRFGHFPSLNPKRPLLFLLHGCKQTGDEFLELTQMLALAKAHDWHVITAEQNIFYHYDRCWNWFLPQNQMRTSAFEVGVMIQHLKDYIQAKQVDGNKIIVMGMSAGAAMANNLAICWPDLITGAVLHSPMPFAPARFVWDIERTLTTGPDKSQQELSQEAYACFNQSRPFQKIMIVHGGADTRVYPQNALALANQWQGVWDYQDDGYYNQSISFDSSVKKYDYPKFPYQIKRWQWNQNQLHLIEVNNLKHAWSGGKSGMRFSEAEAPPIIMMIQRFFKL